MPMDARATVPTVTDPPSGQPEVPTHNLEAIHNRLKHCTNQIRSLVAMAARLPDLRAPGNLEAIRDAGGGPVNGIRFFLAKTCSDVGLGKVPYDESVTYHPLWQVLVDAYNFTRKPATSDTLSEQSVKENKDRDIAEKLKSVSEQDIRVLYALAVSRSNYDIADLLWTNEALIPGMCTMSLRTVGILSSFPKSIEERGDLRNLLVRAFERFVRAGGTPVYLTRSDRPRGNAIALPYRKPKRAPAAHPDVTPPNEVGAVKEKIDEEGVKLVPLPETSLRLVDPVHHEPEHVGPVEEIPVPFLEEEDPVEELPPEPPEDAYEIEVIQTQEEPIPEEPPPPCLEEVPMGQEVFMPSIPEVQGPDAYDAVRLRIALAIRTITTPWLRTVLTGVGEGLTNVEIDKKYGRGIRRVSAAISQLYSGLDVPVPSTTNSVWTRRQILIDAIMLEKELSSRPDVHEVLPQLAEAEIPSVPAEDAQTPVVSQEVIAAIASRMDRYWTPFQKFILDRLGEEMPVKRIFRMRGSSKGSFDSTFRTICMVLEVPSFYDFLADAVPTRLRVVGEARRLYLSRQKSK